jgi:Uncharacterized conserved protein (DUF2190)
MPAVATTGLVGKPHVRTYQAGAANQGRGLALVQGADDNHMIPAAAANAPAFGVQNEPSVSIGDPIAVTLKGEATAIAGAAIVAGAYVITDNQGRFVTSVTAADLVVGRALSSAAVAGDEFVLLVQPFVK